ncbi:MAG: hypothetical protein CVV56_01890 [Tenericutes bacterium HGW-Tenericutes-1]|jgi:ABC-type sugar transport system permease subunit|nr:MAG: hypothetical protein CVV56_01890 [Tenericutes bacterium HGW-Tenericutes-1]
MKKIINNIVSILLKVKLFLVKIWTPIKTFFKKKVNPIILIILKYTGLLWVKKQLNRLPNKIKKAIYGILFILPWLIGMIAIGIPILAKSIRMALSDKYYYIVNQGWQITGNWYDFTQFKRIFSDEPYHLTQILDTLKDVSLVVPLVVIFALILALMLNQKLKGRAIFRTIFFIPVILLSGNMLANFQSNGLLTVPAIANGTITSFLTDYFPAIFSEIVAQAFEKIVLILWLSGVQILIFLAGLQKMDASTYEAAEIDGASMWELFWKITLPALIPLMYINIIYTTIVYSNLSNNAIVSIINSSSDASGSLAGTLADEVNYGRAYSAALSWILFAIELTVIGGYTLVIKLASRRYE